MDKGCEYSEGKNEYCGRNPYRSYLNITNIPGGAVRDIAMGVLMLFRDVESSIDARAIVLDTNIILKDLGYIVKKNRPSTLFSEAEVGFFKLFVTPSILQEVAEHIPKYAKNTKRNGGAMFQAWEIYKQRLIVIDPAVKINQKNKRLLERDSDDAPTAYLIDLVQPYLSLSADKDLIDNGYAQRGDWLHYVGNSSNLVKKDIFHIVLSIGATSFVIGVSKSVSVVVSVLKAVLRSLPKEVVGVLGVALVTMITNKQSRNWIARKLNEIFSNINFAKLFEQMQGIIDVIGEKYISWAESEKFIREGGREGSIAPATLKGFII